MEVEDESVFHFIFLNLVITWFVARLEFSEKLTDKILITKCFFLGHLLQSGLDLVYIPVVDALTS